MVGNNEARKPASNRKSWDCRIDSGFKKFQSQELGKHNWTILKAAPGRERSSDE
jgi:hypothetical protein